MNTSLFFLWPCAVFLSWAAMLLPVEQRDRWRQEWMAELYHRWYYGRTECSAGRVQELAEIYLNCCGSFADAWWHFREDDSGIRRLSEELRSPQFCLVSLLALLLICVAGSGFLPVTRKILFPPAYLAENRIAIVSRTGRLEAIRRGIPPELAQVWKQKSHLVDKLAQCVFPRQTSFTIGGQRHEALLLRSTTNLFAVLGLPLPASSGSAHPVFASYDFWKTQLHENPNVAGTRFTMNGREAVLAGVLPRDFWFLSPAIALYEPDLLRPEQAGMLIVRRQLGTSAGELEAELEKTAHDCGYEFTRTAPHAMFLREAVQTPLFLFTTALLVAVILVSLAHGSRWMRAMESGDILPKRSAPWWGFFLAKTALSLASILVLGLELLVTKNQQTISDSLGGPILFWFYLVSCSLTLFASVSDQQARCRVCQRLLAFPIRIGCPGCLLLDWSGTEFLCTQGHGMLYVPHHVSCWEEADRWVMLQP